MNILRVTLLLLLVISSSPVLAESRDPFRQQHFELPEKYRAEFGGYQKTYKRLSGFEYSGLHWGNFVVVYATHDSAAYRKNYFEFMKFLDFDEEDEEDEELSINYQQYPVGAVIIKENYLDVGGLPKEPASLTIMKKMPKGYDTKHGDWLYIQTSGDGKVILEGKYDDPTVFKVCSDCHGNIMERDYIFSTFYIVN
ncbi:MAG: hypothetical protein COA99_05085 [Moraxellaceae bacterium]|nr:MAG: hypothetical protein COA99_05085 [Moraxellaceae bacterium]